MLGFSKDILCPIRREGWIFVSLFIAVTLFFYWLSVFLGTIGLLLTLLCIYFFRDPFRYTPQGDGLVVAPADGRVLFVKSFPLPAELSETEESQQCISIFMNVFDVHVNRVPIAGKLTKIVYKPGKFFNAALDKANPENERMSYELTLKGKKKLYFVQIAGLVARRILCYKNEGDKVTAGERVGMIRFGSRVDIYLPEGFEPVVTEGQRTLAGETLIAKRKDARLSSETAFKGS